MREVKHLTSRNLQIHHNIFSLISCHHRHLAKWIRGVDWSEQSINMRTYCFMQDQTCSLMNQQYPLRQNQCHHLRQALISLNETKICNSDPPACCPTPCLGPPAGLEKLIKTQRRMEAFTIPKCLPPFHQWMHPCMIQVCF